MGRSDTWLGKLSRPRDDFQADLRWTGFGARLVTALVPGVPRGSPQDLARVWRDPSPRAADRGSAEVHGGIWSTRVWGRQQQPALS